MNFIHPVIINNDESGNQTSYCLIHLKRSYRILLLILNYAMSD